MKFVVLSESDYLSFEKSADNTNFFTGKSFIDLQVSLGRSLDFVGVVQDDRVLAACLLVTFPLKRFFKYMYAPRNFLVDFSNCELLDFFTCGLKNYCEKKGAAYVLVDPYYVYEVRDMFGSEVISSDESVINNLIKAGFSYKGKTVNLGENQQQFRFMFSVDCSGSYDELIKSLHFKTRRNINRASSLGVEVRELGFDELDIFYDIVTNTSEMRGFDVASFEFYQKQFVSYGDDLKVLLSFINVKEQVNILSDLLVEYDVSIKEIDLKISESGGSKSLSSKRKSLEQLVDSSNKRLLEFKQLQVEYGDVVNLSAAMFIFDKTEVCYLTSGSYDASRNLFGVYAIQSEILKLTYNRGIDKYNMYGISGTFDESDPAYGVYKFKQGFTGSVEVLVGDFELVCSSFKYKLLSLLIK